MTIFLGISLMLLLWAILVALLFPTKLRQFCAIITITLWSYFLLYFYMGGLARKVSHFPAGTVGATDLYTQGVHAYYSALWDTQISLVLSITALAILAVFSQNFKRTVRS